MNVMVTTMFGPGTHVGWPYFKRRATSLANRRPARVNRARPFSTDNRSPIICRSSASNDSSGTPDVVRNDS
jgi:hypothetical protein